MIVKGCALDKQYTSYDEVKKRNVVAQGWSQSEDVSFFVEEKNITPYVNLIDDGNSKSVAFTGLIKGIKPGDIILAFEGSKIRGICEMPKDFIYVYDIEKKSNNEDIPYNYANSLFPVKWIDWENISANEPPLGYRPRNPIFEIHSPEIISYVSENWERYKIENNFNVEPDESQSRRLDALKQSFPQKVKESRERYQNLLIKNNMKNTLSKYIDLLKANKNIILTGAPGTGKTHLAKEIAEELNAKCDFVQFHPSFDYTDFVEGLRPVKKDGQSEIGFELKDGIFREFCNIAKNDSFKDYVFVIDEINRAEISKVFGELFFSIDPGYRGTDGNVKTQYSNLREEKDQFFYVPKNVYIIGTMNDIDRSVESFDFAMRRRFTWIEITAEESAKNMNLADDAANKMKALNTAILTIDGLNSSYQIGAAYFLKLKEKEYNNDFNKLWEYHIEPLLKEYLRGMPNHQECYEKLKKAYNS